MYIALTILGFLSPIVALFFVARLICAPFSPKVAAEVERHPVVHAIWGCFAFIGILVAIGALDPTCRPPASVERRAQRQKVAERIQLAGGWSALQKACDTLVEQNRDNVFQWSGGDTNALPAALAALKPRKVWFYSPTVVKDEPPVNVVHIKVFGMHSTGGHSTPYFGLEVVSGPGAESYKPRPSRGGVSGNGYTSYRQINDRIYEIY